MSPLGVSSEPALPGHHVVAMGYGRSPIISFRASVHTSVSCHFRCRLRAVQFPFEYTKIETILVQSANKAKILGAPRSQTQEWEWRDGITCDDLDNGRRELTRREREVGAGLGMRIMHWPIIMNHAQINARRTWNIHHGLS
jgi:hypothetical protein